MVKNKIMSLDNERTSEENPKLYENVLEIEIKKINREYSAF